MSRKEFLIRFWNLVCKPLIALAVAVFCGKFVFSAIYHSGPERLLAYVMFTLVVLFAVAYIGGIYFQKLKTGILLKMPDRSRKVVKDVLRFLDYLGVFLLLALCFKLSDDWWVELLIVILIVDRFLSIARAGDNSTNRSNG